MTLFPPSDERRQNVCFLISCLVLPENKKLDIQNIGTFYFLATVTPAVNELLPLSQKFFYLFFFCLFFFSIRKLYLTDFHLEQNMPRLLWESLLLISARSSHDLPAFLCWYKPDIAFRKYLLCPHMLHLVIWLLVHVKCPVRVCILKYHFVSAWNSCRYYECFVLLNGRVSMMHIFSLHNFQFWFKEQTLKASWNEVAPRSIFFGTQCCCLALHNGRVVVPTTWPFAAVAGGVKSNNQHLLHTI